MIKCVTIVSGGMDSGVLAYMLANKGFEQILLSFDYGQRHKKELQYAAIIAKNLGCSHNVIDLASVNPLIQTSALTFGGEVPDGHYNEDSMRATVVPNRNAMMLTIAFAAGSAANAHYVATGVHSGDRYNYPDCRFEFIDAFQLMQNKALDGFPTPILETPFINCTKAQIAKIGVELNVPFHETWSCYKGGEKHCGRCGTCVERLEALNEANAIDLTDYEDKDYWKQAVEEYQLSQKK